ncbi:cation transporter [uncultured Nocardioides sp.]|uniref:cation transporter n=1 Tax=uncultured Nocardioides sp. TaxID=198441 RepID=UPI0026291DCB|nr:cation transporter [uncultured Nocardioides sp.]
MAGFFGVELGFGLWSGSLAPLSDAGHMSADVVAVGAALAATRIATRKDTTGMRTFGSYRALVFASGLAVLLMLGVAAYVSIAAIGRIGASVEVESGAMLIVGAIGLAVIVAGVLVARTGSAWWDTAIAFAIAVFVAIRAVILGREVLAVLGQHAPAGVEPGSRTSQAVSRE